MTISTERLKEITERRSPSLRWGEAEEIAVELLAAREAQSESVGVIRHVVIGEGKTGCHATLFSPLPAGTELFTAPPTVAVLNGVSILTAGIDTCNDRFEIEIVDWDVDSAVKPNSKVIPDGYKLVPIEAQHASVVPDFGALAKLLVENLVDCGAADDDVIAQYKEFAHKACRAAMLPSAPKAD